jgi:LacI family transcriptional regulator
MDDPAIISIVNDEDQGIRAVLDHLAELGHSRIATIAGPQKLSTGKGRLEAFLRHRDAFGFEVDDRLIVLADAFNEAEGERCADALLAKRLGFTALVCSNDRLAIGAIAVLRRHGLDVPSDVSVTGFNDMPMTDQIEPSLTTVRVHQYTAGRMAAEALLARLDRNNADEMAGHEILPVDLIVRASTAPAPARSPAKTAPRLNGMAVKNRAGEPRAQA